MRISVEWLNDLVDTQMLGLETPQLAEALTRIGFAVEGIEEVAGDPVLDLDVTTNRPDCLSHLGIARELAAYFRLPLQEPVWDAPVPDPDTEPAAAVEILDPDLCPRYSARLIEGITVGESPGWIRQRLEAVGQRPINNIVDITNYVLFELGHPTHAFDHALLAEGRIVVRRAARGEPITTLDDVERSTDPEMLLICDAEKAVAVGGVMGGADSEVSESTTAVLLESAWFDPASIRSTSRRLGLKTEAAYRFERGADPEMSVRALNRATRLLLDYGGGRAVGPVIDANPSPHRPRRLTLRHRRVEQVVGTAIDRSDVTDILAGLQFLPSEEGDSVAVTVPSFRVDVTIEDDLVEEVARHYGYERLPSHYPPVSTVGSYLESEGHDRHLTAIVTAAGFYEAYTLSFTTPGREAVFLGQTPELVAIANPLTEDATHLRSFLLPGLVDALKYNLNHGLQDVRLFETGRVFDPDPERGPVERERCGLIATGNFYQPFWQQEADEFRFHHLSGVLGAIAAGVDADWDIAGDRKHSFLHPGAGGTLRNGDEEIGWLGRLHPDLQRRFKLAGPVFAAEFSLEAYRSTPLLEPRCRPVGRFPVVEHDLSFLVDRGVEFSKIRAAVQALNIGELKDQRLIDLYQGPNLPPNKVSLTVRLTFADPDRTLTQDEVKARTQEVSERLQRELDVEPRS